MVNRKANQREWNKKPSRPGADFSIIPRHSEPTLEHYPDPSQPIILRPTRDNPGYSGGKGLT